MEKKNNQKKPPVKTAINGVLIKANPLQISF